MRRVRSMLRNSAINRRETAHGCCFGTRDVFNAAATYATHCVAKEYSGERARLVCWRACPRDRELFFRLLNWPATCSFERLFRRYAETSTRDASATQTRAGSARGESIVAADASR